MAEEDYVGWINSITFIDKAGKVLPAELTPDTSDDPEEDRELLIVEGAPEA